MKPSNEKIVSKLFKTDDGVTMYLGMNVWCIYGDRDNIEGLEIRSVKVNAVGNKSWSNIDGGGNGLPVYTRPKYPIFSTKQKAINWIIEHLQKMTLKFNKLQQKDVVLTEKSPDEIVAKFIKTEDGVAIYPDMNVFQISKCDPLRIIKRNIAMVSSDGYSNEYLYFAYIDNAKKYQKTLLRKYLKQ